MNSEVISLLVRHILTALAGGLAVKYQVDGDTLNAIVGGGAAAAGLAWSVYDKKKKR